MADDVGVLVSLGVGDAERAQLLGEQAGEVVLLGVRGNAGLVGRVGGGGYAGVAIEAFDDVAPGAGSFLLAGIVLSA